MNLNRSPSALVPAPGVRHSGAWMVAIVSRAKVSVSDMGIDLRGRDVAMAQ